MAKEDDLTKLLSMTDIIDESRLKDRYSGKKATQPSMTKLMQPEEMQKALAKSDDSARLARDIESRIANKSAAQVEKQAMMDFIEKYGSKMEVPSGMKVGSIAEDTARLGMKLPDLSKKLPKALGKAGKIGGGLALGLAGELAFPEEAGDPNSIIENPDASPEERKAAMEAMMAESRPQMEDQLKKQALDDMMEKLRQEKLQRAEMLMKKYGKR